MIKRGGLNQEVDKLVNRRPLLGKLPRTMLGLVVSGLKPMEAQVDCDLCQASLLHYLRLCSKCFKGVKGKLSRLDIPNWKIGHVDRDVPDECSICGGTGVKEVCLGCALAPLPPTGAHKWSAPGCWTQGEYRGALHDYHRCLDCGTMLEVRHDGLRFHVPGRPESGTEMPDCNPVDRSLMNRCLHDWSLVYAQSAAPKLRAWTEFPNYEQVVERHGREAHRCKKCGYWCELIPPLGDSLPGRGLSKWDENDFGSPRTFEARDLDFVMEMTCDLFAPNSTAAGLKLNGSSTLAVDFKQRRIFLNQMSLPFEKVKNLNLKWKVEVSETGDTSRTPYILLNLGDGTTALRIYGTESITSQVGSKMDDEAETQKQDPREKHLVAMVKQVNDTLTGK